MESTSEWQKLVFDAIEILRLHMIKRGNLIKKYKLAIGFNTGNDLLDI
jgi:hypothetical protein